MFNIIFTIVPILVMLVFVLTFAMIFSPKLRAKMMGKQIEATKYMVDEHKDDIRDINTNMAEASREGIRITTGAIKEGLMGETIYCKHCGSSIESDSKFCKSCGSEQ